MTKHKQNRRTGIKDTKDTHTESRRGAHSRDSGRKAEVGSPLRFAGNVHVGIRALDWRRPASREGRDASQERTLILNRGPSCSERQFNERVFRGRITVVYTTNFACKFRRSFTAACTIRETVNQ